jgi:hypothetical protein
MFRFTIRDVLWLTVVVAIVAAFWGTGYREARRARDAERQAVETAKRVEESLR